MKLWSDFYDLIIPDLPGCPIGALPVALRQAAIAFCEQSLAWNFSHPDITVTVANADYDFSPPDGAVVHAIDYAEFNDQEIEVKTAQDDVWLWNWRHQDGTPQYVMGHPTYLTLIPTPNVAGTVSNLTVFLKPSPIADGIDDDDMFNEYREAIIHGAKGMLMTSPKKPYTDLNMATYHQQQFRIATAAANIRTGRNYTRAPLQTQIMRRKSWR
jgi:hypothetical protein